ncbi:MAG: dienelactone hydrolase family protein [Coriobacteriia bacterium]
MDWLASIPAGGVMLEGALSVPETASGVVLFAHGSGSSRLSPRNNAVARRLRASGHFGTLLFDLLTPAEDADRSLRFDIPLLAERLTAATDWLRAQTEIGGLRLGYFGASTGAAAALISAARRDDIGAIVSRGGRPDLAGQALTRVTAPTLLIVGGADPSVLDLNEAALHQLAGPKELHVVEGATHLFEEPGALDEVAEQAGLWFERYLRLPN